MSLSRNSDPRNVRCPFKVVLLPPGKAYHFHCLTDGYVSLNVHYTGTGAKVCPETDDCKSCLGGSRQIFSGYVLGRSADSSHVRLVHLTGLAAYMLKQEQWRAGSIYGAKIILNRIGQKKNGPVEAFLTGWTDDFDKIEMESLEHAVTTLYKLHRLERRLMDKGKPMDEYKPHDKNQLFSVNGHKQKQGR